MTPLDPPASDRSCGDPVPTDATSGHFGHRGSAERPAGAAATAVPRAADSTAADPGAVVPEAPGAADGAAGAEPADPTAARLLAGLAARLRGAYECGTHPADLATACHRSEAEVRRLLAVAGADLDAARPVGDAPGTPGSPVGTPGDDGRQLRRARRPVPSRRLRRLHPRPPERQELWHPAGGGGLSREGGPLGGGPGDGPPLGILIGGSSSAQGAGARQPERVDARLVRVGAGTCLVVLPAWREAIAVAVPTERLLASTGLAAEELAGARLSVLINPEALHDRDLGLHGWQADQPH